MSFVMFLIFVISFGNLYSEIFISKFMTNVIEDALDKFFISAIFAVRDASVISPKLVAFAITDRVSFFFAIG